METHAVLFVCSANICRSPMAEWLLRHLVRAEADHWDIASAGVWALPGNPAAENTVAVLRRRGIEIQGHISKEITREMMNTYQLILTMERGQKEALQLAFPEHAQKVFLLSEMVSSSYEIVDPIGKSPEEYEATAEEIEMILRAGMPAIRDLSSTAHTRGKV